MLVTHLRLPLPGKEAEATGVCPAMAQDPAPSLRTKEEAEWGRGAAGVAERLLHVGAAQGPSSGGQCSWRWGPARASCRPGGQTLLQEAHSAPACLLDPAPPGRKRGQLCQVSEGLGTGQGRGQSPGQVAAEGQLGSPHDRTVPGKRA